MKDQYVADFNDFGKYVLLRELAASHNGRLVVAWMRTLPDNRRDGRRLAYLQQPERYRSADPDLFDRLYEIVAARKRSIAAVEEADILPGAHFHSELLPDEALGRHSWFASLMSTLARGDLVFLDPDNGFAVPTVPIGRRGSSKYLYWDELAALLESERTACVYQHFPRRTRAEYLRDLMTRITVVAPAVSTRVVTTSQVAFVLVGPPRRVTVLLHAAKCVADRQPGVIQISD